MKGFETLNYYNSFVSMLLHIIILNMNGKQMLNMKLTLLCTNQ